MGGRPGGASVGCSHVRLWGTRRRCDPARTPAGLSLLQPRLCRCNCHPTWPSFLRAPQAEGGAGAEAAIRERERQLLPVYHQVAVQFAQVGRDDAAGRRWRRYRAGATEAGLAGGSTSLLGLAVPAGCHSPGQSSPSALVCVQGCIQARRACCLATAHPAAPPTLPPFCTPPCPLAPDARRPGAHAGQGHAARHRALAAGAQLLRGTAAPEAH